jgi:hypothetical protein
VVAFLRIREMALNQPFPFVEDCYKGVYLTYARNVRFVNEQVNDSKLLSLLLRISYCKFAYLHTACVSTRYSTVVIANTLLYMLVV